MTDIVSPAPIRALDANGDVVPAAEMFVFRTGTDTEEPVFSDQGATTQHPSPIVADSAGIFPAVFSTASVNLKIDVRDPDTNASLPGFPIDPVRVTSLSVGGASQLSFAPTSNIPATTVQAAIEAVDTNRRTADAELQSGLDALNNVDNTSDINKPVSTAQQAAIDAVSWKVLPVTDTSSGAVIDFDNIPADTTEIEIDLLRVSMDTSASILVRLGASGTPETTGYQSNGGRTNSTANATNTTGFFAEVVATVGQLSGRMFFRKIGATNDWNCVFLGGSNSTGVTSSGAITLPGVLDILRLEPISGGNFDNGQLQMRYR